MKASDERSSAKPAPDQHVFLSRPATLADLSAILALEREAGSAAHWPERTYRDVFAPEAPARVAILLEDEGHVACGFVVARLTSDECELENIAVSLKVQRKGAGTQLIQSLIAMARERSVHSIHLEVRESNHAARALYEKCGFANTGRRPRYYSGPEEEDAVLYSLHL